MHPARYSREDAHELILAEWRALHPKPMDSLPVTLPIFVEQVLASPLGSFPVGSEDPRETIRRWVRELEADRQRGVQAQHGAVATL